ncbi:alkaline phosphatase D family protein [Aquimarina litoralis]|uniref:alkaline phosphatase D family protein n=1 Tax=Aquimarina litoralis TaxID=584605 RepID=UPI001C59B09C|nr:alkaline phosphatase D family protein [Aquimarina litoralis]MBW1297203.1 T9SS type A sorting domain-containing protein [Aquimarina litoralis]
MKSNLRKLIFLFLCTHFFYAQDLNTVLTKIERTVDAGNISDYFDSSLAPFYHGVASGDPLENAVIIWTRVTTNATNIEVNWKIAKDPQMNQIAQQGIINTNQSKDYTVKVDVKGLEPYTTYYYQFESLGVKSIVGKTRTAPRQQDMVDNLRFAIVSCSNYQDGYFNAYNQIANRTDLDAVIHLGDYIYEYESGGYGYSDEVGRGHVPENETITLNDYRVRHSYYKLDPMLRNVHQQHAFINIWDDHEFANDANKFGAENHTPSSEGDWQIRKNNAFKAYFEWMPVRANSIEQYRLYRKISYGKLMDLIMLDTRIEGRDTQVNSSKNIISAAASNDAFKSFAQHVIAKKDLSKEKELREVLREVLPMILHVSNGKEESKNENALTSVEFDMVIDGFVKQVINKGTTDKATKSALEELLSKSTKYQEEDLTKSNKEAYTSILGSEQFTWLKNQLQNSSAKWRIIGNQVMIMPWNGVPSNDAWDGYQEEREQLLGFIKSNNINNVIALTGDIHSTFVGEVRYNGDCEMCEFVVPSVSSTNLDFLGGIASGLSEFYVRLLNRHIKDVDLDNHGYYVLDVKEDRVQADWFDTNDVSRPIAGENRSRSWYVNSNNCRVRRASQASTALNSRGAYQETILTEKQPLKNIEEKFVVVGVYPNPVLDQGNIHYAMNSEGEVIINLFDIQGRLIQQLQKQDLQKGIYNLSFDVNGLKTGNYIISIESESTKATRNIIVK